MLCEALAGKAALPSGGAFKLGTLSVLSAWATLQLPCSSAHAHACAPSWPPTLDGLRSRNARSMRGLFAKSPWHWKQSTICSSSRSKRTSSRQRELRAEGQRGAQERHQDILLHAPPFLLMGLWCITHGYLLSLQLQEGASSTSLSDILPLRWLLLIGIFPSLLPLLATITPTCLCLIVSPRPLLC